MIAPGEATVGDRYPGTTHPHNVPDPTRGRTLTAPLCVTAYGVSDTMME